MSSSDGRIEDAAPRELWPPRLPTVAAWPVGFCVAIAAAFVAWFAGAGSDPLTGLVVLGVAAATCGAVNTVPGGLIVGVQCWAGYTGFVRDRLGVLRIDSVAGRDLAVIAGGAVAASLTCLVIRRCQAGRLPQLWADPAELAEWAPTEAPVPRVSMFAVTGFPVPHARRHRHGGESR